MKKVIPICFLLLMSGLTVLHAQAYAKKFRLYVKIFDGRTKNGIKRIPVTVMPFNKVIDANNRGELLLNLPLGNYGFKMDTYPFDKKEVKIELKSDTTLLIELHSPFTSQYIQEVEINAQKPVTTQPAGLEQIDIQTFKVLPALIGERDILKAFALTAGVTSSSEGAADLQVRGGLHGQNLYLLDGIPLYSTEHLFGLVSAYNPIIVKSARLYKSDFPAEYGGKISSVVNVLTQDANPDKFGGEIEISLLSSKALLNIPIVKNKLAVSVSGRISNYSLINLTSLYNSTNSNGNLKLHFGDINANLLWKLSERDKIKLTWFNNSDGIDTKQKEEDVVNSTWMDNKQQNLGLCWYRNINKDFENQLLAYMDSYSFDLGNSNKSTNSTIKNIDQIITGIKSIGLENKLRLKLSNQLNFAAGGSIKMILFSPIQLNHTDTTTTRMQTTPLVHETEGTLYGEAAYQPVKNQKITAGLRASIIGNTSELYPNIEPRIGYHGIFARDFSVSASVCRMTQSVHRLANPGLGIPFEMFLPSIGGLVPESSWNFSLGAAKDISFNKDFLSLKIDSWYKSMNNIAEFQDGYDALSVWYYKFDLTRQTKEVITQGKGKAYGVDFSADYSHKNWSLAVDYTLMQAINRFANLNNGQPFAAATDIRHSLSLTLDRKLSSTLTLGATWQYLSGRPITVPTTIFLYPTVNPETGELSNSYRQFQALESNRNNYRTAPFHKLDVTLTQSYKAFKKFDASYSIGVYNLYNQRNPYIYYISQKRNINGSYKAVLMSMSMFPILPSFSWSLKF
ncbi:MAG TPA: hypothetical protein VI413_09465 [Paludibacter sp.]